MHVATCLCILIQYGVHRIIIDVVENIRDSHSGMWLCMARVARVLYAGALFWAGEGSNNFLLPGTASQFLKVFITMV